MLAKIFYSFYLCILRENIGIRVSSTILFQMEMFELLVSRWFSYYDIEAFESSRIEQTKVLFIHNHKITISNKPKKYYLENHVASLPFAKKIIYHKLEINKFSIPFFYF